MIKNHISSLIKLLKLLILFFTIIACKEEFNINAPWKDITIVYGFINSEDSLQIIRINKIFQCQSDLYSHTQNFDSLNYKEKLKVEIYELNSLNDEKGQLFVTLDTMSFYTKKEGIFHYPRQQVYFFLNTANHKIKVNKRYKLQITKPNGEKVTATTDIVSSPTIYNPPHWDTLNPPPSLPASNKHPTISFINSQGNYTSAKIEWTAGENAFIYNTSLIFYYTETLNGISKEKSVVYDLGYTKHGFDRIKELPGELFYSRLQSVIPIVNGIKRRAGKLDNPNIHIEVKVTAATKDLSIYMDVHTPSGSLVQERPDYTNINNGLGIFSSRATKSQFYKLNSYSHLELISGKYTKDLSFSF